MVNIDTGLFINTPTKADLATAAMARRALSALLVSDVAAGIPKPGVIQNGNNPFAVGSASSSALTLNLNPGYAVTTRSASPGLGGYLVGSSTTVPLTLTAASASNPRIDTVYVCQPDPEAGDATHARIDALVGTPAASPTAPAATGLPQGALVLFDALVPAGATAGTAVQITDRRTYTGLVTGMPVYANNAALPANPGAYGALAVVLAYTTNNGTSATNMVVRYNGTAWKPWDCEWQTWTNPQVSGLQGSQNADPGWGFTRQPEWRVAAGRVTYRGTIRQTNGSFNGNPSLYIQQPILARSQEYEGAFMGVQGSNPGTIIKLSGRQNGQQFLGLDYWAASGAGQYAYVSRWNMYGNTPFVWNDGSLYYWDYTYDQA
jgi:hypothetical protein